MQRCLGCMHEFDSTAQICPYCGYACNTPTKSKNHLQPGTVLQNRYTIGKALGQGGFGITYIAWDLRLEKPVAVKEYFPTSFAARVTGQNEISCFNAESQNLFASGLQKMMNESRTLARFTDQPNIVQVLDCIEENGTAYIIMELLRGETVKNILDREKKLSLERTMEIVLPILHALDAIHQTGLVHRDVSPDNIFVCEDGTVKLLDFGAARIASDVDRRTLSVMLKKGFAPVEQYSSHGKQGACTDVYAVCATMYKMLTGVTPACSTDRMTRDSLCPIRQYTPIPESVEAIILKGMAVEAADRTQSAGELCDALQDALRQERLQSTAAAAKPERARKTTRTQTRTLKKIAVTLIVLVLAALIACVVLLVLRSGRFSSAGTASADADSSLSAGDAVRVNETEPDRESAQLSSAAQTQAGSPFVGLLEGHTVKFGTYEQDGDTDNGEEAIEWIVVDTAGNNDKLLLLSRYVLDCLPYHTEFADVTWAKSSIHKWLSDTFCANHLPTEEKRWIEHTWTSTPDNEAYGSSGGMSPIDLVFLLSLEEVRSLDPVYRVAQPTKYAAAQGAYQNPETGKTWWLLRSPGSGNDLCAIVRSDGDIRAGGEKVNIAGGIRPAMWVKTS